MVCCFCDFVMISGFFLAQIAFGLDYSVISSRTVEAALYKLGHKHVRKKWLYFLFHSHSYKKIILDTSVNIELFLYYELVII